ncbi:MAG: glycosyltransferase family 39 protein [Flavobacteriales bacterium]|nr:glycosyltransferase family 39 protein [Flavobacteriales bacterium]
MSAEGKERKADVPRSKGGIPGEPHERVLLWCLVGLAAVLRFWEFTGLPFLHDELSALVRLFPTLEETIRRGVVELDTHPPGVQVFEWVWTRLFGLEEWVVKLPFVLFSLASIPLAYRVASAWSSTTAGLLIATLMATLQFTVLYGQLARPYAIGLFSTLLMADQWIRYHRSGSKAHLIGMGLGALISAYTHHVALLQACAIGGLALWWSTPKERRELMLMAAAVALCYVPNVPLFLKQLGMAGLDEWLRPPTLHWPLDFVAWLFHGSPLLIGTVLILGIWSWWLLWAGPSEGRKPLTLALVLGLLPVLIVFFYSLLRSPILQYSLVLFSFPYLLIALFAGIPGLPFARTLLLCTVLAAQSISTLIVRGHFSLAYQSKYEAIMDGILGSDRGTDRLTLVEMPPEVLGFYAKRAGMDPATMPCVQLRGMAPDAISQSLYESHASEVFLGITASADPELVAVVQDHWPFLRERRDLVEGQTFVFASTPSRQDIRDHRSASIALPEAVIGPGWRIPGPVKVVYDTARSDIAPLAHWDLNGSEYGPTYEALLDSLVGSPMDLVEARAVLDTAKPGVQLVVDLVHEDRVIFHRSSVEMRPRDGIATLWVGLKLPDLRPIPNGTRIKVFVWDPQRQGARIQLQEVRVREGNEILYGLFDLFERRSRFGPK